MDRIVSPNAAVPRCAVVASDLPSDGPSALATVWPSGRACGALLAVFHVLPKVSKGLTYSVTVRRVPRSCGTAWGAAASSERCSGPPLRSVAVTAWIMRKRER